MKTKNWLILAALVAIALLATACGREKATAVPAPEASPTAVAASADTKPQPPSTALATAADTPQPAPTSELEADLSLQDLAAEAELDSYRSTTTITFKGTKDGAPVEVTSQILTEYTRNPLAQHIVYTTAGTGITETGTIEIYSVEGMQYVNMQDQWFSMPVTDTTGFSSEGLIRGDDMINDACDWKNEGKETLDGVRVQHWALPKGVRNECFAALKLYEQGQITTAGGDLYVAVDGKYVFRMTLHVEGKGLNVFGASGDNTLLDEGRMEFTYTMADVNKPLSITVPEEALKSSALPDDIPTPPDATGLSQMFGMISFTTTMTVQQVADFYRAEMPKKGWEQTNDSSFGDFVSLEFSKGDRSASFMISKDTATGNTSVLITEQGE